MKKIKLSSILLILTITFCKAQTVNIPDTNFLNALISIGVDTSGDNQIQTGEALAIEKIIVHGKSIADLTGIEAFTNLTYLACDTNSLSALDVSNNLLLDTLNCNNNSIAVLDVTMLSALSKLNCASNKITTFDPTLNLNLKWFDIGNNPITTLDVTKNVELLLLDIVLCASLNEIDLSKNLELEELLALINLNNLKLIDVSNNSKLTSLNVLFVLGTGIPKTICVSETQLANIPEKWYINSNDSYTTTCEYITGIEENQTYVTPKLIKAFDILGNAINLNNIKTHQGVVILMYDDGSTKKVVKIK